MPDPVRIVVSGATGRMGSAVIELIGEIEGVELAGGVAPDPPGDATMPSIVAPEDAGELLQSADVVVDFSAPELLRRLLDARRTAGASAAFVIGTTGLEKQDEQAIDALSCEVPVVVASNFSVGVNVLLDLAERAAGALDEAYDVEIVEAHHRRKEDAPSGTALSLGAAVAAGRGIELGKHRIDGRSGRTGARPRGEIAFHALRGGDIVGEHRLFLVGERERIELAHVAIDRDLFAEGALRAARWVADQAPGRYAMRDVLGLD